MTGHCDADVLAEFREGLLGRRRTARIRAHLAGCSRCAALSTGLAEVSTLLASAPAPRMPDELVARLDGVLAAESAARAQAAAPAGAAGDTSAAPDGHGAAPDSTGAARRASRRRGARTRPARPARQPRPWGGTALRAASVTAAVLVVAGGGYGVSRLLQGGTSGPSSSAASGPAHSQQPTERNPFNRSRAGGSGPGTNLSARLPVIHSGINYVPGHLPAQVAAALARPQASSGKFASDKGNAALPGCVGRVTRGSGLRLVDLALYQGRPATIIVQNGADGRPRQVWVVGADCSANSPHILAHAQLTRAG
jgi:hypothetical protein